MAYTPELSQIGSATLRRLAWHLQKPMTKSLEMLIEMTATKMAEMRPGEVCNQCKDDSICKVCPFHLTQHSTEICEMSGLVLLKGGIPCRNVRISLWF